MSLEKTCVSQKGKDLKYYEILLSSSSVTCLWELKYPSDFARESSWL